MNVSMIFLLKLKKQKTKKCEASFHVHSLRFICYPYLLLRYISYFYLRLRNFNVLLHTMLLPMRFFSFSLTYDNILTSILSILGIGYLGSYDSFSTIITIHTSCYDYSFRLSNFVPLFAIEIAIINLHLIIHGVLGCILIL